MESQRREPAREGAYEFVRKSSERLGINESDPGFLREIKRDLESLERI